MRASTRSRTRWSAPRMPRFGMRTQLPARYHRTEWFGRGPIESYLDRKAAADVGRWTLDVAEWAIPYARDDLDPGPRKAQRHWGELRPRDAVFLNIDYGQMGVGGINSRGPTALEAYSLPCGAYEYRFRLVALGASR